MASQRTKAKAILHGNKIYTQFQALSQSYSFLPYMAKAQWRVSIFIIFIQCNCCILPVLYIVILSRIQSIKFQKSGKSCVFQQLWWFEGFWWRHDSFNLAWYSGITRGPSPERLLLQATTVNTIKSELSNPSFLQQPFITGQSEFIQLCTMMREPNKHCPKHISRKPMKFHHCDFFRPIWNVRGYNFWIQVTRGSVRFHFQKNVTKIHFTIEFQLQISSQNSVLNSHIKF